MTLLKPEYANQLPATARVLNAYEALYYNVKSGDEFADTHVRDGLVEQFESENKTYRDMMNDPDTLNQFMKAGLARSSTNLARALDEQVTTRQMDTLYRRVDQSNHARPKFHATAMIAYERKHGQMPDTQVVQADDAKRNEERRIIQEHIHDTHEKDMVIDQLASTYMQDLYQGRSGFDIVTPQEDMSFKRGIQRSFSERDYTSERLRSAVYAPSDEELTEALEDGMVYGAKDILLVDELDATQEKRIRTDVRALSESHPDFHMQTQHHFERRYNGESMTFDSDYMEAVQDDPRIGGALNDYELDAMFADLEARGMTEMFSPDAYPSTPQSKQATPHVFAPTNTTVGADVGVSQDTLSHANYAGREGTYVRKPDPYARREVSRDAQLSRFGSTDVLLDTTDTQARTFDPSSPDFDIDDFMPTGMVTGSAPAPEPVQASSGLNYGAKADVSRDLHTKTTYESHGARQAREASERELRQSVNHVTSEMKDTSQLSKEEQDYDAYAQEYNRTHGIHTGFTASDDFGFDEKEDEDEFEL